jgi:hypothetical protein
MTSFDDLFDPSSDRVQCELEMSSCRLTTAEKRASQLSQNRLDTITEIDTLELQQTEKIETEIKDVDRIPGKCTQAVQGGLLGRYKSSSVRHKYMLFPADFSSPLIKEDLPGRAQLVFTFDTRFSSTGWPVPQSVRYITFRLQASYLSATSHTGRKSCRVKSLYMKRFWIQYCSV